MSTYAMAAVITVNVWRGLPFFAITVLAGLMSIPREFYEAAEVDGASSCARFWHVTLPLLKPVLAVVILFSTIFTFDDFNIVYVLTRGGPVNTTHLFATLAYQVGLQGGNLGQGAAISLFMLPDARRWSSSSSSATSGGSDHGHGVRSRGARLRSTVFGYANLVPFVFFALFPFYFMLITSFKSNAELYNLKSVPFWIQSGVIIDHYRYLFAEDRVPHLDQQQPASSAWWRPAISLVISMLAGYSLARLRFRGVGSFGTAVFITYLVPPTLLFLPLSQVVVWLGHRRHHLGADRDLPDLPGAVLHVAAHGLLPHDPPGDRGVRTGRRGQPHADAAAHRAAHGHPRDRLRGPVRLHAHLERVHLRAHVHLPDAPTRRPSWASPRT